MIVINSELVTKVSEEASQSNRKRKNFNFHKKAEDTLQRMLNAFEPDTYVRPHKHENPDKREVFIVLTGKALVVEFDKEGKILKQVVLDQSQGNYAVEIPPRVFHTIVSLVKGTVMYELKDGPYLVENDKNFATWAPEEGSVNAPDYLKQLLEKCNLCVNYSGHPDKKI